MRFCADMTQTSMFHGKGRQLRCLRVRMRKLYKHALGVHVRIKSIGLHFSLHSKVMYSTDIKLIMHSHRTV